MHRLLVIPAILALVSGKAVPYDENERIVGGQATTIQEQPHQVALEYNNRLTCGGSVIKSNVILTAAHCIPATNEQHEGPSLTVRAGTTFMQKDGVLAQSSTIHVHPKYSLERIDYDVAVIVLEKALPLGPTIRVVPLQEKNVPVPTGTMARVTGWGRLQEGGPLSDVLQAVEIPKVDHRKCWEAYQGFITDRMTCYGYTEGGKGSCQGDSGGPLVANGKQVGIVSFAKGCARPNYPTVFADVANPEISDFIQGILNSA